MEERIQRLEQLARLLEKGAITREEFDAQKATISSEANDFADTWLRNASQDSPISQAIVPPHYPLRRFTMIAAACVGVLAVALVTWPPLANIGSRPGISLPDVEGTSGLALVQREPIEFSSDPMATASRAFRELLSSTETCETKANLPSAFENNYFFLTIHDARTMEFESPPVLEKAIQTYNIELNSNKITLIPTNNSETMPPIVLKSIWREGGEYKVSVVIQTFVRLQAVMSCH